MTNSPLSPPSPLPSIPKLVIVQAIVSAASLVVEIVAGRMLAPFVGMSLYTWTSIIAVVLAGFSAGHWAGGRMAEMDSPRALRWTGWAMLGAALTTAGALFALRWGAAAILPMTENAIVAIVALSTAAFFLPSFFAGIPAPVLAQISVNATPDRSGRALGAMFAAGAIGAIAGTLLAGFVFVSWLGSTGTLVAVTAVYLASAAALLTWAGRAGAPRGFMLAFGTGLAAVALAGTALAQPSPCTRESDYFCIRTVDMSADPTRPVNMMVLDHLVHGMAARDVPEVMFYESAALLDRLTLMRMGDDTFSAFLIGGGTFSVPRKWALLDPAPDVTVAEIDPAVTEVAMLDFWFDPTTARVLTQDARHALRNSDRRFDVVLGDAFTDIAVPEHLVTKEFFQLVRDRLTPDGVYLMNVIDHADNLRALASVTATLEQVFPVVEIWTEARSPQPGQRLVFTLVAGNAPSPVEMVDGRNPDPTRFGQLTARFREGLQARAPVILTDDYAPVDRLIGTRF
ncbi:fused MFS/spermidine synthase [Lutimaribacter sp. EGI FJ00015]|uniref:Fused MFS/spermidine synthase n=1 Tax=Lutimaribacter degradans TaxID=2945989 RepID=A0ACC5ZWR6_9RHOB|nr:fused MFS/spermidine synthase [Lutimaribacter sp. EGI FJ00013]MCM2562206.1 fused MFS/spermidine synthase [Lutimaribacter sp. EGI FJ00013]MCO0613361.1 fused MFS/spermidine synthase [Lutimaribacter sp. EGI FJ00015]MCO0636335.1 fused MFS/spermidine synthase [Lutimaribacter sp. EGI FJ00014]